MSRISNWIYRSWHHNRTYTKLLPLINIKPLPFWLIIFLIPMTWFFFKYSQYGFQAELIPYSNIMVNDVISDVIIEREIVVKKKNV
jgi:hypothetical protein